MATRYKWSLVTTSDDKPIMNDKELIDLWDSTSGSGVELMSLSDWNALTTAEKQSKGLVAIQASVSGYNRGVLVNGADYINKHLYIPYSDEDAVLCEAYADNFDADADTWGYGDRPLQYYDSTKKPVYSSADNAVLINTLTDDVVVYHDTGDGIPITIYAVVKATTNGTYKRFVSNATASGQRLSAVVCQNSGGTNVLVSTYGDDTAVDVSPTTYFAMAIKLTSSSADFFINSLSKISKEFNTISRYTVLGKFMLTGSENQYPSDNLFRYFAVVEGAESDTVIANNLTYLQEQLIGE
jgi:hypothetical protein